ncbi:hypothetical protein HMJ29_11285 [Hymenobacter taeanensis]|uniref:Uncharacterized protein n=1 Tax=Hymenobacter taeanensis TaxID=2735321 RepID=A0A6M6BHG1_9BACT|nr:MULTISPECIES: hypothetical protein [Hymenobacter]QJX47489.1 hypothetical protein HMJ29_11285 [Hymenobacter taeanensis]UOQ83028.1 hypothetical protein MUN83_09820 [Hymenobacter sp. 5414T-23]
MEREDGETGNDPIVGHYPFVMEYRNWLITILILTLIMWAMSVAVENLAAQTDPKFLRQYLTATETDARVKAHVGDVESSYYEFQTTSSLPDTITFAVTVDGKKGTVIVRGRAVSNKANDQWHLVQADTIFSY